MQALIDTITSGIPASLVEIRKLDGPCTSAPRTFSRSSTGPQASPPQLSPRLPQAHSLHRAVAARNRRLETWATPSIVKSPIEVMADLFRPAPRIRQGGAVRYEQESDSTLWLDAISGTERAFVAIFDRYRARIFRAAFRKTNSVADAEEVVAIVFFEAWRLRKRVRIVDGSLLPWLLTVASNVTSNLGRSHRRYARMLARLPPPEQHDDHSTWVEQRIEHRAKTRALSAALATLSPGDRAVVDLCLIEELTMSDAATALNVPVGTVKSRLNRARRQLRSKLSIEDTTTESGRLLAADEESVR